MRYDIKRDREHYVVYINGEFYCTADKQNEAAKEIEEYMKERRNKHENKSSQEKLWRGRTV